MDIYNKNRDKNKNLKDEIREQNAKLKEASLKEKISYFKEYYLKMTLGAIAVIAFTGSLIYSMVTAPSDTAFAAYFFNCGANSSDTFLQDAFIEYAGIDTKEHEAYIDTAMHYSMADDTDTYDDYVALEKSMAVISTKELDVIVGNTDAFDYFSKAECFHDITTVLPEDLLEQFRDKIYYYENEETGELLPLGIYVSDAPKLAEYQYFNGQEPILGFIVNSNSMDNAILFLRYLYTTES